MKRDPIRLLDDPHTPDAMRSGLEDVRAQEAPFDADAGYETFLATIGAATAATTGAGAGAASSSSTTTATSAAVSGGGLSLTSKVVLAVALTSGSVGSAFWIHQSASVPPRAPTPVIVPSAPTSEPKTEEQRREAPLRSAEPTLAERPTLAESRSSPQRPSAESAPRPSIEEETKQLAELRGVEGSDPGAALRLAEEGHARFPRGIFFQEREAIAILALRRLGRVDEARSRADRFAQRFPRSPFVEVLTREAP